MMHEPGAEVVETSGGMPAMRIGPASAVDDVQLVERVRAGDEAAFEVLFRRFYAPLVGFLVRFVDSEDLAEELVQELFLQIWTDRTRWQVTSSVRAYLFGAARNRALNHLKHRRVARIWQQRAATDESLSGIGSRPPTPEEAVLAGEIGAAVRDAIQALPERARMVAVLRWQHGLSYAEIAESMAISRKGVENQLGRVARQLRERLAPLRL